MKKNYIIFLFALLFYLTPFFLTVCISEANSATQSIIYDIKYIQIEDMAQITVLSDTQINSAGINWYKIDTDNGYKLNIDILSFKLSEKFSKNIIESNDKWIKKIQCTQKNDNIVRITINVIGSLNFRIYKESKKLYVTFKPVLSDELKLETPPEKDNKLKTDIKKKVRHDLSKKKEDTITIQLENADIREVLKLFADAAGYDIIIKNDVSGEVTASFTNVPVFTAFEYILDSLDLVYDKKGNILKVRKGLSSEIREKLKMYTATKIYKLKYAKASILNSALTGILTEDGSTIIDERTNTLIVKEIPENISNIDAIVKELDSKTPQVIIEAKILDVTLADDDDLGVEWDKITPVSNKDITANFKISRTGNNINLGLINSKIDVVITALQSKRKVEILSSPKIVTLDNHEATIEVGDEVPIRNAQTTVTGTATTQTTSYDYKQVLLKLRVTPQIQDNLVFLDIVPEVNFVNGYSSDELPIIGTRKTQTQVLVKDGQTLVMGGLIRNNNTELVSKVPILGRIPVLGNLFKKTTRSKTKTELIILISVHILNDAKIQQIVNKYKKNLNISEENKELLKWN